MAQYGLATRDTFSDHRFVTLKDRPEHLVWNEWIHQNVAAQNLVVLASNHQLLAHAIFSGCGIGVLPQSAVNEHETLIEMPMKLDWQASVWALVHRDMLNMPKIRTFIDVLLEQEDWPITFL